MNSNISGERFLSTHRCVVNVPGMTTKGFQLSKEIETTDQNVLLWTYMASDRQGKISHCLGCLQTRLNLSSGHSSKRDSTLKTVCFQSDWFFINRANTNITGLDGTQNSEISDLTVCVNVIFILSGFLRVMLDTCVPADSVRDTMDSK